MEILLIFLIIVLFSPEAAVAGAVDSGTAANPSLSSPFTEKAALIRYWNRKIPNQSPHPAFLVSKLTPLSAADAVKFSKLAADDPSKLSSNLSSFCSAADLLCYPDPTPSLIDNASDSSFSAYENTNFSNYGRFSAGGLSFFTNYSGNEIPFSFFHRYARFGAGHDDAFSVYGPDGNVVGANFTSYGQDAAGGNDSFTSYDQSSNVPDLGFNSYSTRTAGRTEGFSLYSNDANSGDQSFSGYNKAGAGPTADFSSYANNSNVISSGFEHYGQDSVGNGEKFTSYGDSGNIPENNFKVYGSGSFNAVDKFVSYRDQSNIGDDSFANYEKNGDNSTADFSNYGNANEGSDAFKGYAEGSGNDHINFTSYFAENTTFKSYAKTGVDFKSYRNSSVPLSTAASAADEGENHQPSARHPGPGRWVEPGRFFRESSLKKGTVMPMPDIRDRMPPRSFLPRSIAGKIPFSAASVTGIFKFPPETPMAKAVASTVGDCERAPSRGETKRCATSAEDMIDFAVSVLGRDVAVRSTASTKGSKGDVLIGEVKGVNGGKITESVSCHQSLFPYLVYYCHSVPRVRVYDAEILAVDTKEKINRGIAICHLDTSDWSSTHGAFVALGPGPGKIEVCHWIFVGDMTWTVADRS